MGSDGAKHAAGDGIAAHLPQDDRPWYKQLYLLKLNFIILSLVIFSSAGGFDGALMSGLLALPAWQKFMHEPSASRLGVINAVYTMGSMIVFIISPYINNRFGRKVMTYVGCGLTTVGVGITFTNSDIAFMVGRALLGAGAACFYSSVPLLISELAYPTHRSVASALFMTGYFVGGTLAGFLTYGIMMPAIALPGFNWAPESPRWLISMGRLDEARAVLQQWHSPDGQDSPLVDFEMTEIAATLAFEQQETAKGSWSQMWKTKGNRHRLFISVTLGALIQWSGSSVVSYYLVPVLLTIGVTSVRDQILLSGAVQLWGLVCAVTASLLVNRVGRRPLFLASVVIMFAGFAVTTGLSGSFASTGNPVVGTAVIPFLFVFVAGFVISFAPLLTSYPCEIWQYSYRSRGLAVTFMSTNVSALVNLFVNPIALEKLKWKYYFVFMAVLAVFGVIVYFAYPKTRGHSLEHMAVIFDGDEAAVPVLVEQDAKAGVKESEGFNKSEPVVTYNERV